jgi:hypothetical protein
MDAMTNTRTTALEAFAALIKKSTNFAHELKRFGYETLAAAKGMDITTTGRRLRRGKKSSSGAFAFLIGSDNLATQLDLAQNFNPLNWQAVTRNAKDLWNRVSTITASPSGEAMHAAFTKVSAPQAVVQLLKQDQLSFEQEVASIKVDHAASGLIGPSAELFSAFENSTKTHKLQVTSFDDAGAPENYAHCATKVQGLTDEFRSNVFRNALHNIFGQNADVSVYGNVITPQIVVSLQPDAPQATNQLCPVTPHA